MAVAIKRIYDTPSPADGARLLVDRLWPRGVSKGEAQIDHWLKDIAPSDALRKRLHGTTAISDAAWKTFRAAYDAELASADAAGAKDLATLRAAMRAGPVTLLYAARDEAHNNAVALRLWLEAHG